MFIRAVRGAVQIKNDSEAMVDEGVRKLVLEILQRNGMDRDRIISIQFTVTTDIKSKNPAAALRGIGFSGVPLFCCAEPETEGALPRVIRVMILTERDDGAALIPVYMDGAEKLRPDLGGR